VADYRFSPHDVDGIGVLSLLNRILYAADEWRITVQYDEAGNLIGFQRYLP
jgi:hypothetical protein